MNGKEAGMSGWAVWMLAALFLVFATPTPMAVAESGETVSASVRGTEYHSHLQSRERPLEDGSVVHVDETVAPLFALPSLIFVIPLALRSPGRRIYHASISLLLRIRMLMPRKFTSTYVS